MPIGKTKNIGDYIQILATRQFYDNIDGYIEKEELSQYGGGKCKAIINGWFMWKPDKGWPPSEEIEPLLISIHFSPLIINEILSKKEYLMKHSPIGCRDFFTLNALREAGINSYFSGCLTLTLGRTYHFNGQRSGYYFVDPVFTLPLRRELNLRVCLKILSCFFGNAHIILHLSKNRFFKYYSRAWGYEFYKPGLKGNIKSVYKAICFYMTYRKKFSDKIIQSANYINHIIPVNKERPLSHDEWLDMADGFLKKYSSAELVVTSRIHAALPCLALETPVIFMNSERLNSEKVDFNTPGRLDGLTDFFRVMTIKEFGIVTNDDQLKTLNEINLDTKIRNKDDWREYSKMLSDKCTKFMN